MKPQWMLIACASLARGFLRQQVRRPAPIAASLCDDAAAYAEAGKPFPSTTHDGLAVATFGGGCFWGLQLAFDREPGVVDSVVGYTHGHAERPTYADVCDETTGHTEAVLVKYSPEIVSFARLAAVLFDVVGDPTTLNRVGRDRGTNYRTGMYCHSDAQLRDAEEAFDVEDRSWQSSGRKVVTEVKRAAVFWPAEAVQRAWRTAAASAGRSRRPGCTDEIRCGRAACLRNRLLPKTTHAALRAPRRPDGRRAEPRRQGAWFAAELFGKAAALTKGAPAAPLSTAQPPRSVDEACKRLAADYEGADGPYFLTGIMDAACYDDDCEFADPFVSFKGRARFEENLANLGGGFISDASIRTLGTERTASSYTTKLMVKLRLALPWQPVLAWPWGVEHVLDVREDEVVVVRHLESWDVSAAEGVRQLFRAGPPGPLSRKKENLALGALPEAEADGWTGEPSAWADEDSFTQQLSGATQKYAAGFKQFVAETVAGDFDAAAAKELLDDKGATYTEIALDEREDGAALRARLGKRTGRTSVPAVWIGDEYVGGLNDGAPGLVPLDKAGELDGKLKSARAL
ncbi:peptide-methionine (S)-S-oxide reductase [Aureococcus anophagefferens]|nr:peptide-methionine (S)-S-oxide reductase [Aureococcus anophagefferens]